MQSKILILGIAAMLLAAPVSHADKKNKQHDTAYSANYNFEVETVGVGSEGTKSLKVWAFDKTVDAAVQKAKKNAVAACIYRGLPASTYALATPALCANPDPKWDAWFNAFFSDNGPYLNYVNLTSDGDPSGQDRLRTKTGYKVGVYIQVRFDALRKALEDEGIIVKMTDWF